MELEAIQHSHEHQSHPGFKCVLIAKYHKSPEELIRNGEAVWHTGDNEEIPMTLEEATNDNTEHHALLYTDGYIALTIFEHCYALWFLDTGELYKGSIWQPKEWYLTAESIELCKKYVEKLKL